jgi:hypothetical protein
MRNRLTRLKKADPFTLGREKENPPVEKYTNGDPDSWAETPYDKKHWEDDKREETNHAAESDHNFGASVKASVKVARELREKALKCVHIASALFPTASEETLEAQGFDLMELSDRSIEATLKRIAEMEEMKEDEAQEEEQEEVMKEARSLLAKVRSLIAEAEEGEKEEALEEDEACEDEEEMNQAEKAASVLVKKASALVAAAEYEEEIGAEEEAEAKKEEAKQILAKAKKILAGELPPALKENAEKMKKLHEEGAEVDNSKLNTEGLEEAEMSLEEKKEAALRHLAAAKKLMAEVGVEDKEEAHEEEAQSEAMEEEVESEEEAMEEEVESEEEAMEDEEELSMEEVDMIPSEKDEALEDLFMSPDMKDAKEAYEDAFGGEAHEEKEEKQASKTASKAPKKGAKTLKGGLKISSVNSAEDLSNLWDCPPDVSHLFK